MQSIGSWTCRFMKTRFTNVKLLRGRSARRIGHTNRSAVGVKVKVILVNKGDSQFKCCRSDDEDITKSDKSIRGPRGEVVVARMF